MAGYGRIFFTANAASNYRNLLSTRNSLPNVQLCATLKSKALEKLGLPPRPSKPLNNYLRFIMEERKKLVDTDPPLSAPAKVKLLTEKWKVLDHREKDRLQKEYDLDMLAYSKQMMAYQQSITPEQRKKIADMTAEEEVKREKRELKKRWQEMGRPKKPPTGFLQFMQENKFSRSRNNSVGKWVKDLAVVWNNMAPEEKVKYTNESTKLMEQYKEDMKIWEENMVRKGHIDVVRNRGLIDIKLSNPSNTE